VTSEEHVYRLGLAKSQGTKKSRGDATLKARVLWVGTDELPTLPSVRRGLKGHRGGWEPARGTDGKSLAGASLQPFHMNAHKTATAVPTLFAR
jgi:hypothetical protein